MKKQITKFFIPMFLLMLAIVIRSSSALAQETQTPTATPSPDTVSVPTATQMPVPVSEDHGDTNCLMCHFDPDFSGHLGDGSTISLYIDPGIYYLLIYRSGNLLPFCAFGSWFRVSGVPR
jgi:hypothetical protein